MTLDQLEELKARLTAATGPDDLRPVWELSQIKSLGYEAGWNNLDCAVFEQMWDAGAHLSAVIALTEAVLPGCIRSSIQQTTGHFIGAVIILGDPAELFEVTHKSEPIALLLATVSALIEREKNDG